MLGQWKALAIGIKFWEIDMEAKTSERPDLSREPFEIELQLGAVQFTLETGDMEKASSLLRATALAASFQELFSRLAPHSGNQIVGDVSQLNAERARLLQSHAAIEFAIQVDDEDVLISDLTISLNQLEITAGSVKATAYFSLVALGVLYNGIAVYPSFREGLAAIASDFELVSEILADDFSGMIELDKQDEEPPNSDVKIDLYLSREDRIYAELEKAVRLARKNAE